MMKLVFLFFLLGSCGLGEGMIKEYFYISSATYWDDAQRYCKQSYSDLAIFSTEEEQQRIAKIFGHQQGWIGLRRQSESSDWQWTDGEQVSFSTWDTENGYPRKGYADYNPHYVYYEFNYAYLYYEKWQDTAWFAWIPFYCYRHLILVNESKTWEEALQYCTTHYTGLASLAHATQVNQAIREIALTLTESVWTGLRFMDGRWFWLSRETVEETSLPPSCPPRPYHCGAFNNKTNIWENRDCNEKLNFLCYLN